MMDAVVAGRYRLVEQVATSLMSEVWRAHDLELDRPVVLKLLGPDADPERFEREAQAAAGLSHPNICLLYDYGETDGRRFIVFELLAGGSLEDRLAGGQALPDGETARIAGELASALAYAHARGLVHRDVKPTNVLFDEDGRAKLADFGVARISDESTLTEAGTVLGTAAYLSPEQATGEAVGPATDVYSFGVILYRMLTGRLPFESKSALELAAMHATKEPPTIASRRAHAPPELERLAMWALAKRPEDRPRDGSALLAELTAAVEVEEETQVLAPVGRRIRRHHVAAGVGLALLALAGAAVAVLATPESSEAPVTSAPRTGAPSTRGGGATTTAPSTSSTTGTTATTARTDGTSTAPTNQPPPPPPPNPTTTPPTTQPPTESLPTDTTVTVPTETTVTVGTTTP